MDIKELSKKSNIKFSKFPYTLFAKTEDDFKSQSKEIFTLKPARKVTKIVYIWVTEKEIPRLRGKSNILYIGKTNRSLYRRHAKYAGTKRSRLNWNIYIHIRLNYGKIRIFYTKCKEPKKKESKFLSNYLKAHLEHPPLNRAS